MGGRSLVRSYYEYGDIGLLHGIVERTVIPVLKEIYPDLNDLYDKIVKRKISEIQDQKELKKSLGNLKSFVKFSANGTPLNEKRIGTLKSLGGRFLIVTNTDLPMEDIVSAYKEQWQNERSFRTIKIVY